MFKFKKSGSTRALLHCRPQKTLKPRNFWGRCPLDPSQGLPPWIIPGPAMPLNTSLTMLNGSPLRQSIHKIAKLVQQKSGITGKDCYVFSKCICSVRPFFLKLILNANAILNHSYSFPIIQDEGDIDNRSSNTGY